jgi:ribonucleoside-diphosphate reductase alpha chain
MSVKKSYSARQAIPDVIYRPGDATLERSLEESPKPFYSAPVDGKYSSKGLKIDYSFAEKGVNPFNQLEWESRVASITDDKGGIIFQQPNVRIPKNVSPLATNVMASKYFYGDPKVGGRESSMASMIHRVSKTVTDWGARDGYFKDKASATAFYSDLTWLLANQHGAFNSPVWFNMGLHHLYGVGGQSQGNFVFNRATKKAEQAPNQYEYPQASACFIQRVDDNMGSIMALATSEANLFKYGSGSGTDLTPIRSTHEKVSGGGKPSGPLSFLKVYDAVAGVVKSGGKTRRAAKMNTMDASHPDILPFINAKSNEEKKAWALIDAGYSGDFNGEAYGSVAFQNENLSVRVGDDFMQAVVDDKEWTTHHITDPTKAGPTYKARDLMKWISEGAWLCGDPGIQFKDTINRWHTAKNSGAINSSNPCSEYLFLDNTACNLASLNLQKFLDEDGKFNVERYKRAAEVFITAQEIFVDNASYPTKEIAELSHRYRTLGLGYANLGGLEMRLGLAYDSEEGRELAGALTAIIHNTAYAQSAKIAKAVGAFPGYVSNKEPMLGVIKMHRDAAHKLKEDKLPADQKHLAFAAKQTADEALELGIKNGYRNAQVTVLAPTGTIGFLMDADTTGVEPDIALVKYKLLAGGGMLKIVNKTVEPALTRLGYNAEQIANIIQHIDKTDTIEGAADLKQEHLSVFDCAFKPKNGIRYIDYMGHVRMMAAVQPHLSGAISKTINMPTHATAEQIRDVYMDGWKLGLKALAIYRDGCKRSQPINTGKIAEAGVDQLYFTRSPKEIGLRPIESSDLEKIMKTVPKSELDLVLQKMGYNINQQPVRKRMPETRDSKTHKFEISGHEGYFTVGLYEDGKPGELFINMAKEGSTVGGMMDAFGTAISLCLQYGVPLEKMVGKFKDMRFEPSGFTRNENIRSAKSIPDYIFQWFAQGFLNEAKEPKVEVGLTPEQKKLSPVEEENISGENSQKATNKSDSEEGWIHICTVANCGALAKDMDAKGCRRICKNGHDLQMGCGS